jgi:hypothetical protein
VNFHQGAYSAKLLAVSGGALQVDAIVFSSVVAQQQGSWGQIKSLYRAATP